MTTARDEAVRRIGERVLARLGFAPTDLLYQRMGRVVQARMKATGLGTLEEYQAYLDQAGEEEWGRLAEALTINETYLFREPKHFEAVRKILLEIDRAQDPVRILSAGCASGEEVYSLAITAHRALSPLGRRFEVVGCDIDGAALAKAREGLYGRWSFREDGMAYAEGYVRPEGDRWRLKPQIRQAVRFEQVNLVEAGPAGPFHIVFCRNMLMYLTPESRRAVVERLVGLLAPGGALFIGSAETLEDPPAELERTYAHGTHFFRRRAAATGAADGREAPVRLALLSRSPLFRLTARQILRGQPGLEVVAEAADAEALADRSGREPIDLVLVDGSTVAPEALPRGGVPALVTLGPGDDAAGFAGAEVVTLLAAGSAGLRAHGAALGDRLRAAALRPRRPRAIGRGAHAASERGGTGPLGQRRGTGPLGGSRFDRLLLIGCSTGGPGVVSDLLQRLPPGLGLAILIVQHMPAGFTATFAERLNRMTPYRVLEASSGAALQADVAYVAPGHRNTLVGPGGSLRVVPPDPGEIYMPSVDRTFHSVAASGLARRTLALVLTGMGDDGAEGLAALRAAGAATIVQDPSETVVAGMVNAAIARGGAERVLAAAEMPDEIARWVGARARARR